METSVFLNGTYLCLYVYTEKKKKRQIQIHQKMHLQNVPLAEHRISYLKHSCFGGGKK